MKWMLAAMLMVVGLAGCAEEADEPAPIETPEPAAPPVLVDAMAAWSAGDATANLDLLAHWQDGGGEEADAWGDYIFVDRGSTIHIVQMQWQNGTEALELMPVSSLASSAPKDVKVSDDGNWLFLGNDAQLSDTPGLSAIDDAPQGGGIYILDVSDKETPRAAGFEPVGPRRGPHMVFYHQTAAGDELVFGANADISIHRFDPASVSLTELSRYAPNYVTDVNRDPDVIDAYYQTYAHDMFVMEDFGPATAACTAQARAESDAVGSNQQAAASAPGGPAAAESIDCPAPKTMMYVANWDAGLRIVDVTDPSSPTAVGGWNAFPDGHAGNLHTVSTEWIGDRRITVGSVEVGFAVVGGTQYALGDEESALYIWDTTDPGNIQHLATWLNPDGAPSGRDMVPNEAITSSHNLQLEGGRVYMAHYAMGVFVIDINDPSDPHTVAFHHAPGMNTWDVIVHQGVMFSSGGLGLQALHFPLDELGPGGIRSRA